MDKPLVSMSDAAARRIAFLMEQEGGEVFLRISVNGGGCSGFQYGFTFDDERKPDDYVIEKDGAVVAIDATSQLYIAGSQIDFIEDLIGSSFRIINPNATASCGCGSSFAV